MIHSNAKNVTERLPGYVRLLEGAARELVDAWEADNLRVPRLRADSGDPRIAAADHLLEAVGDVKRALRELERVSPVQAVTP